MKCAPWATLRDVRYALPGLIERRFGGPGPGWAAAACGKAGAKGFAATIGYFQACSDQPDDILAANLSAVGLVAERAGQVYLSVKAPPLAFDTKRIRAIAEAADAAGLTLLFDAHAPHDADRTVTLVSDLLQRFPGTGLAIPARWGRSPSDAARLRDGSARIRIVKGEWADSTWSATDIEDAYIALITALAGRTAPVAVATHHPKLAQRALTVLRDAGTPCELEQLRGLPCRRTTAIARRLGVPIRLYIPFGPGWWPYALDKALGRPYLPLWQARDMLGIEDRSRVNR